MLLLTVHRSKVVVLGSLGAGKSTLIRQLCRQGTRDGEAAPSAGVGVLGVDMQLACLATQLEPLHVTFWDINTPAASSSTAASPLSAFLRGAHAALVVFAADAAASLASAAAFKRELDAHAPGAPCLLVQTKSAAPGASALAGEAQRQADALRCRLLMTDAATGAGVAALAAALGEAITRAQHGSATAPANTSAFVDAATMRAEQPRAALTPARELAKAKGGGGGGCVLL